MAIFCSPGPEFCAASDGGENAGDLAGLAAPDLYRARDCLLYP